MICIRPCGQTAFASQAAREGTPGSARSWPASGPRAPRPNRRRPSCARQRRSRRVPPGPGRLATPGSRHRSGSRNGAGVPAEPRMSSSNCGTNSRKATRIRCQSPTSRACEAPASLRLVPHVTAFNKKHMSVTIVNIITSSSNIRLIIVVIALTITVRVINIVVSTAQHHLHEKALAGSERSRRRRRKLCCCCCILL